MTKQGRQTLVWLGIGLLFFWFLYEIRSILLPFVVGILTAYFLDPVADHLETAGWKRGNATLLITALFFSVLILACVLVVPLLAHQCAQLADAIPGYIADLQGQILPQLRDWMQQIAPGQDEALRNAGKELAGSFIKVGEAVLEGAFASGIALLNIFSLLLITPLVAFYLLRDWDRLKERVDRLLPVAHAATIRTQMQKIDATLAGFLRGQMNVCLILSVYYGTVLSVIGLKFGLVLGILSGMLVILPYVGIIFMALCSLTVGLLQFGTTTPLLLVGLAYLCGQPLEGYFLTPRLVGGKVGLHPLWIIFGMLSGAALFGLLGVLIAIPTTAVIGVLIRFAIERYLHSTLYYGQ